MMSLSLQPYLFACTDVEQHVFKVASFGDLPAGVKFPLFFYGGQKAAVLISL